ncbi:myotrophin-like [Mya arenaria]|uniref:myotrophin-like n=1 Tax=Mya arenaria TaxID=6604 RepID=UPI0022E1A658|nr:myotrophin-like [Mya arenaria]
MADSDKLLWGVKNGDLENVQEMISKPGVDVNAELSGGRNALHFAADYGQTDVIKCLLKAGADVNKADKHGITPLLAAIWESHEETVTLLLQMGADKNGKSPDGETYIQCAETDDMKALLSK